MYIYIYIYICIQETANFEFPLFTKLGERKATLVLYVHTRSTVLSIYHCIYIYMHMI